MVNNYNTLQGCQGSQAFFNKIAREFFRCDDVSFCSVFMYYPDTPDYSYKGIR